MPTDKHNPTATERDECVPSKHKPTEAERDERVKIQTDLTPEEALALVLKVDPESEPVIERSDE